MIIRLLEQHLASQEQDARQPRLAMEADGSANTKTRKRTEGAATAVQAMHGDSCSADRVDLDSMCSTSSGDNCTGPPAPPCSGRNVLIDNRAAAPKLSLILGDALTNSHWWLSSHRRNLYNNKDHLQRDTFSALRDRGDESKRKSLKTSIPSASYDSSF